MNVLKEVEVSIRRRYILEEFERNKNQEKNNTEVVYI